MHEADYSYYRGMALKNAEKLMDYDKTLFEVVEDTDKFDRTTGKYATSIQLRKGVNEDDLVRSYIEMTEDEKSKPAVNKNGFEAYYGKGQTPDTVQQKQEQKYSTGGYY